MPSGNTGFLYWNPLQDLPLYPCQYLSQFHLCVQQQLSTSCPSSRASSFLYQISHCTPCSYELTSFSCYNIGQQKFYNSLNHRPLLPLASQHIYTANHRNSFIAFLYGLAFSARWTWSRGYYLNIAPFAYYGLKPPVFKGRFAILVLTIAVLSLRAKITPTAL